MPPRPSLASISKTPWPSGLLLRAREIDDAAAIAELHNLPGYRWGTMRLPYQSVEEVHRSLEQQAGDARSLVAILEGRVVGDISLQPAKGRRAHTGTLGMGVHDDHTRRGIGRTLLREALAIADDWLNLRRIELTVYADNEAALALYTSAGFEIEGRMIDYAFRAGLFADALSMARLRR